MSEESDPLLFRNRETLDIQKKYREEIVQTVRAFSAVLSGGGGGTKPDEKALTELRNGMTVLEDLQRSLPTDTLGPERRHEIDAALLIAGGMVWNYLSAQQRREFFPKETAF